MQASNTFKKAFLKLMLKGLKLNGVHSKSMSFQERKRAIKLSADVAMATARGRRTNWSRTIFTDLSKQEKSNEECERLTKPCCHYKWKIPRSKKILRRSLRSTRSRIKSVAARILATNMVKKRTQVLKRIIPGGESLDSFSLLGETLDYIIHLRAQVDLMQRLTKAVRASNLKSHKEYTLQEREASWVGR